MSKRSTKRQGSSIGTQAGSALDVVVQPAQSVADSMREAASSTVSGVAAFMKGPAEAASRQDQSATRTAAQGAARKTRTTAAKVGATVKSAARKPARKAAPVRARTRRRS